MHFPSKATHRPCASETHCSCVDRLPAPQEVNFCNFSGAFCFNCNHYTECTVVTYADREMCRGLGFWRELSRRRERLPQFLQLHPRMLLPLWGEHLQLKKTTSLIGFPSAEQHKDKDCCGRNQKIGATILKMSTVEQGWIRFFSSAGHTYFLHFRPCLDPERCHWEEKNQILWLSFDILKYNTLVMVFGCGFPHDFVLDILYFIGISQCT